MSDVWFELRQLENVSKSSGSAVISCQRAAAMSRRQAPRTQEFFEKPRDSLHVYVGLCLELLAAISSICGPEGPQQQKAHFGGSSLSRGFAVTDCKSSTRTAATAMGEVTPCNQ